MEHSDRLSRRNLLLGGVAVGAVGFGAYWWHFRRRPDFAGPTLSPGEANAALTAGQALLVDIRRPDEWARTGLAQGAHPLDMRREDFVNALATLAKGDRNAPIVLICAAGVRSARMARALQEAGFTNVADVPEGMMGSGAGPGWIRRGLPVTKYEEQG